MGGSQLARIVGGRVGQHDGALNAVGEGVRLGPLAHSERRLIVRRMGGEVRAALSPTHGPASHHA
jgi:hypothetical protein